MFLLWVGKLNKLRYFGEQVCIKIRSSSNFVSWQCTLFCETMGWTKIELLTCDQCGKGLKHFKTREIFYKHIKYNHSSECFTCDDSQMKFENKKERSAHKERQHESNEENFQCSHCTKQFKRKDNLITHMRTHIYYSQ